MAVALVLAHVATEKLVEALDGLCARGFEFGRRNDIVRYCRDGGCDGGEQTQALNIASREWGGGGVHGQGEHRRRGGRAVCARV